MRSLRITITRVRRILALDRDPALSEMKRADWLLSICALLLALLTILQGCGSNSSQTVSDAPTPAADAPHPVTDLSQVAPGNALEPIRQARPNHCAEIVASERRLPA